MIEAMKAVNEAGMGVNRAALEYGVPRTTLKDRISGVSFMERVWAIQPI